MGRQATLVVSLCFPAIKRELVVKFYLPVKPRHKILYQLPAISDASKFAYPQD